MRIEEIAAYVSNPYRRQPSLPGELDPGIKHDLVSLLERNKVQLAYFPETESSLGDELALCLRNEVAEESSTLEWQRGEFDLIQTSFRSINARSILFKSTGRFPYKSDNLDVLIERARLQEAIGVVRDLGYIPLAHWDNEPDKYLFRRFDTGHKYSTLHLHVSVQWDGPPIVDVPRLFEGARLSPTEQFYFPAPEDSLLIALGHIFFENRVIHLLDLRLVWDSLQERNFDWDRVRETAARCSWEKELSLVLIQTNDADQKIFGEPVIPPTIVRDAKESVASLRRWFPVPRLSFPSHQTEPPFTFSKLATKPYTYARMFRGSRRDVLAYLAYIAIDATNAVRIILRMNKTLNQKAYVIALSGVDGSGKTEIARELEDAFRSCGIETDALWTRTRFSPGVENTKKLLRALSRKRILDPTDENNKRKLRSRRGVRAAWTAWSFLHSLWSFGIATRGRRMMRKVTIYDRHLRDATADLAIFLEEDNPEARIWARALRSIVVRPDVAIWIRITPDTAVRRRDEIGFTLPEAERLTLAYEKIQPQFEEIQIDGERSFDDVADAVVDLCMRRYFSRYRNIKVELQHATRF